MTYTVVYLAGYDNAIIANICRAKPGASILNQRILIYEKKRMKFMLREKNLTNFWQLKLNIYIYIYIYIYIHTYNKIE